MNRNRFQKERTLNKWLLVFLCVSYLLPGIACNKNAYAKAKIKGKIETIVVSAEGLVDINADIY